MMEQGQGLGPALERLYQRRTFGLKPGLAATQRLCALTGHPESRFVPIHIAGTNGKGSTAAMLEAVLRQAGLRTGLYTSPHLVRFNERIRLHGADATDEVLAAALARCERASEALQSELGYEPTFFEVATVMAFLCMCDAGVQLGVIETGLGGRLDATNVVTPLVSVITRIGMDHEQYLGHTLAEIAGEKAGIIKPGRPVVSAPQEPEAAAVLRTVAQSRNAPLFFVPDVVAVQSIGHGVLGAGQKVRIETQRGLAGQLTLPLEGLHQLENLGVAIAALELILEAIGLDFDMPMLREGLKAVRWPGRMQLVKPHVLLDAAHNPDGAAVLVRSLRGHDWRKVVLVTGMCADKHVEAVVRELAPVSARVFCCRLPGERGMDPQQLAAHYERHHLDTFVVEDLKDALAAAEAFGEEVGLPVVVAGSIFLAGAMLELPYC
ncbi:MAG: bifunctional folylpolyglutamate synthase/dihydrofolate synthase [Kiritimatiellia bacterium]